MEVARSSKMLVSNHHTTQCNNTENQKFYFHHSENLNLTLKKRPQTIHRGFTGRNLDCYSRNHMEIG